MKPTTDTPRTDAVDYAPVRFWKVHAYELACSSRQLERELNASKAEVEKLRHTCETLEEIRRGHHAGFHKLESLVHRLKANLLRAIEIAEGMTGTKRQFTELDAIKATLNPTDK